MRVPRRLFVIAVEFHDPKRFATREYRRLYDAVFEVDEAIHRLRALLPEPGAAVDEHHANLVSEAEQDLVATWVRYLRAYDAVHLP